MKKLFTFLILLSLALGVAEAQSLATFETGATDKLVIGEKYTGYRDARWVTRPYIGTNDVTNGMNTSEKCYIAKLAVNTDWWGALDILYLTEPVIITEENRYLKFLAYRSDQTRDFGISVNNQHDVRFFLGKLSKTGEWVGVVADLKNYIGKEVSSLVFVFMGNWTSPKPTIPPSITMFDNFELSSDPLPPGVNPVNGTGLRVSFENEAETNQWVEKFDSTHVNNSWDIIDNPFTTSTANSGGKIVQFNKGDVAWWQGFRTVFNGPMPVGNDMPKYLHTMVYVPAAALGDRQSIDIQICAKDHLLNESVYLETIWDDQVDEWIDIVQEINTIKYLKEVTVRYDVIKQGDTYVNAPANIYYLDDIVFNNDPEKRTQILYTGLKNAKQTGNDKFAFAVKDGIRITDQTLQSLKIFNSTGALLQHKTNLSTESLIPVEKGFYLVQGINEQGKLNATKVIVK